jgi:hypothetical protein
MPAVGEEPVFPPSYFLSARILLSIGFFFVAWKAGLEKEMGLRGA